MPVGVETLLMVADWTTVAVTTAVEICVVVCKVMN
jgi:hypothetical protein